ncbi:general secretion pathway protein GspK [bacterium]|nr:general secretion pathway protein GspK [bacterium]
MMSRRTEIRRPSAWVDALPERERRGRRRTSRRRAVILILVLWITTVLSLLAYSVIYQMTMETRLTSTRKKTVQARALARAGLARGFVDLRNDMIFDRSDEYDGPFDAEGDIWADPEEGKEDVEMGEGTFNVVIRDEERFFNINKFRRINRDLLQEIIEEIGYEEEDAKIVACAIIDYGDSDDVPVLDSAPATEGLAYGTLRAEDQGLSEREEDIERMVFPNEGYLTVDELLEVYGVTPELYFGPGTPEAEYFREKIGPPAGDRFQIKERRSRRNEEVHGLRDYFTVHGDGDLNINTAPQHVLQVLLSAAGASDGERMAENIIKDRRGGKNRHIDNDDAFQTKADMQSNGDLVGLLGAIQQLCPLDVQSTVFTLTSTGQIGQVKQTLEVTVDRDMVTLQRDETFEAIDRAREREERYEDRRQRRQDKDDELLVRMPNIRIIQWNRQ